MTNASKTHLILDTCCDLPFEMLNREEVELVNFPYIMSDGEHLDDLYQTTAPHEFFQAMRKGEAPTTSQVPMAVYLDAFTRAAQSGVPTACLCFSSGLSGSYDAACMALEQVKQEYPDAEIYLVDTLLASVAEALLVAEALRQLDKGLTASELAAWAEEARFFVDAEFMVEDLETLRRGGRISSGVAFAGAKLDVKPLLSIGADGKLFLRGVARGRKKGLKALAEYYQKRVQTTAVSNLVVIGDADCKKDAARLKEELLKVDPSLFVIDCNIGPVIGSHVGPGMIAVVFWGPDKREDLSVADRIARKVKNQ